MRRPNGFINGTTALGMFPKEIKPRVCPYSLGQLI